MHLTNARSSVLILGLVAITKGNKWLSILLLYDKSFNSKTIKNLKERNFNIPLELSVRERGSATGKVDLKV